MSGLNHNPVFTQDGKTFLQQVTTANANLDGTGAVVTVVAVASTDPAVKILTVKIKAIVTTTAGMVRLFIFDGTDVRLWEEIPVTAITPSATIESFEADFTPTEPLVLEPTHELRASTENTETMNVIARGFIF